jgi:hypothetical protein
MVSSHNLTHACHLCRSLFRGRILSRALPRAPQLDGFHRKWRDSGCQPGAGTHTASTIAYNSLWISAGGGAGFQLCILCPGVAAAAE